MEITNESEIDSLNTTRYFGFKQSNIGELNYTLQDQQKYHQTSRLERIHVTLFLSPSRECK